MQRITLEKKLVFDQMITEQKEANRISAIDNVELKQYHLGRKSILRDLLNKMNNVKNDGVNWL